MKNTLRLSFILLLFMVLVFPVSAGANTIGYVDFEFLFDAHPEYATKNADLQRIAEDMTVEFQLALEDVETEEEAQQLAIFYEGELEKFAEELRIYIIRAVQQSISAVAVAEGISVVLPDTSVIYGGVDITQLVVAKMYEEYGISVPSRLRRP